MKKTIILSFAAAICLISCSGPKVQDQDIMLSEGWSIQASSKVDVEPGVLSTSDADCGQDWYKATVPCTVLGALTTDNGLYQDAFIGKNYKDIDKEQFNEPWWYRTSFDIPALKEGQRVELAFDGISYRADVWLNGTQVASADELYGPFRQFSFDVTDIIKENNCLAVKVHRWQKGEFNIGFVDWNPRPADESMGIFRPVWLRYSNAVSMKNPVVRTQVDTADLDEAWVSVEAQLSNSSTETVKGKLCGKFNGKTFRVPVELAAGETKTVKVTADDKKALYVNNPHLWWCHNLGNPEMYTMELSFVSKGKVSDAQTIDFGIRQIDSYLTEENYRGFILNGKKVLIKGAGWTDDMFLRNPDSRNALEVAYVKDMNMNAIRFEEVWGTSQNVYDECDRQGVMALVGWSCHWEWEVYTGKPNDKNGCISSEEDMALIAESFRDQVLWLRNHPSVIGWYGASDMLPRPALEQRYLDILEEIDPTRPYMVHAGSAKSSLSGPAGMKMWGPYEWQAPYYWYNENAKGNAVGFNTEIGIGAQMPVKESLVKFIPEDKLWPVGSEYDYHTTTSRDALHDLNELKMVINKRMGGADNLDEFLRKAHFLDYEGTRAMIEAHRVNVPRSTGVIQWMLNSAWPSLYWQMYDWYLVPTSAYWSVKKGCAPQQLIYNYEENFVYAVNDEKEDIALKVKMNIYDLEGKPVSRTKSYVTLPMGASKVLLRVPPVKKDVNFIFLSMEDENGNIVSRNEYCVAKNMDEHDWSKYRWWRTQMKKYADFSSLDRLAAADMDITVKKNGENIEVTLNNKASVVAFFVRMAAKDAQGEYVIPAFWNDNLVTLAPGETRTFTCRIPDIDNVSNIEISGWNIKEQSFEIQ